MIPRLGIQRMHLDAAGTDGSEAPMQAGLELSAPAVHCSLRNPQEGPGPLPPWQQHDSYAGQRAAAVHTADSASSMEEAATGTMPQLQLTAPRSPSCEARAAGALHHPELPGGSSSVPGEDSQGSDSQSDDVHDEDEDDDVAYGEPASKKSSQKRRNKPPQPKALPPGGILLLGPCNHCGVTFSPQWRKGTPDKPVLCNACGIRLRRHKSLDTTPASLAAAAAAATAAAAPPPHKRRSTDGSGKARGSGGGHHVVTKVRPAGRPPTAGGGGGHSAAAPRSHASAAAAAAAAVYSHHVPALHRGPAGDSAEEDLGALGRLSGGSGADGGRGERTRRKVVTWNRLTHERTTGSPSPGAGGGGGGVSPGGATAPSAGGGHGQAAKHAAPRHTLQQLELASSSQAALAAWGSSGSGMTAKQGGSAGARRPAHRSGPGAAAAAAAAAGSKAGAGAAWQSWGQGMAAGAAAKHYAHAQQHTSGAAAGGLAGHKRPSSALGMGGGGGRQVRHPSQRRSGPGSSSDRHNHHQQQQLSGGAAGSGGGGGGGGSRSSKGMWGLGLMSYGSHSNLLLPLDSPSRTLASSPLPGGGHGALGEDEDMCSLLQEWTQGGSLDDLAALGDPGDEGLLPPEEAPVGHAAALHSYAAGLSAHGSRGATSNAAAAAAAAAAMAVAAAAAGGVHSGEHQQAVGLLDHVLRQPMASTAGGSTAVALSGSRGAFSGSNGSLLNSSWTSPSKALQAYNSSTLDARAIPWGGGGGGAGGGSSSSTSHGAAEGAAPHSSAGAGGAPRSSWLQKGIPLSSSATCIAALAEAAAGGLDPLGAPPSLPSQPLSLDLLDQGAWSGAPISPELLGSDALALEVFGQMGMLPAAPVVGNFPNLAASPDPLKALAIALHQEQQAGKQAQQAAAAGLPSQALEGQWGAEAGGEAGGSTGSNKPGGSSSASEQQGSPTAHGSSAAQQAAAAAAAGKVEGPDPTAAAAAVAGSSGKPATSQGAAEGRQVARQLPMGEGAGSHSSFGRDAPVGVLSAHTLQQLLKEEVRADQPQHPHQQQQQQQQLGVGGGDSWVDEWNLYDSAPAAATLA